MFYHATNRRRFIKNTALVASGLGVLPLAPIHSQPPPDNNLYLIGPQPGYTPRIGTLLSTMTMMREWVLRQVEGLTTEQLDYHLDDQSNSIGAMLLHLAATEKYYQLNTFDNMEWDSWSDDIKKEWDVPMNLGPEAREIIVGHELDYYLSKLSKVRAQTAQEFAKRDDGWLAESVNFFDRLPTNNHAKWFHVCEHESNHNGQIKFIKKRLPA